MTELTELYRFTTRDGRWGDDNREYGLGTYSPVPFTASDIPGAGAATNLFVRAPLGSLVTFVTDDGDNYYSDYCDEGKNLWVSMPMWGSSGYDPTKGDGPWNVYIDGQHVAEGLGLPWWWHISTFMVYVPDVRDEPPSPTPPGKGVSYQVVIRTFDDGELVSESIVWET